MTLGSISFSGMFGPVQAWFGDDKPLLLPSPSRTPVHRKVNVQVHPHEVRRHGVVRAPMPFFVRDRSGLEHLLSFRFISFGRVAALIQEGRCQGTDHDGAGAAGHGADHED